LYELPRTDPQFSQAFRRAFDALRAIPHFEALRVLDRDEDMRRYRRPNRGQFVDFHPRINPRMCELDIDTVRVQQVNRLIDTRDAEGRIVLGEISRLPRTMTQFFLRTYRIAVNELENRIRQLRDELSNIPPPSPQRRAEILREIAELQAEINRIQPLIRQLEEYEARLPQIEAGLQARAQAAVP
jgi:hypothetical protein